MAIYLLSYRSKFYKAKKEQLPKEKKNNQRYRKIKHFGE